MSLKVVQKPGRKALYLRGTVNGVRYDESTGTNDRRIAEAYRVKRERELHEAVLYGDRPKVAFAEAANHYVASGGSTRFLSAVVRILGSQQVAAIGQADVDRAARAILPAASGSTVNRQVYTPASAVLHHAALHGWCAAPVLKRPSSGEGRVRWLTKPEAARLLGASSAHLRPLVQFLLYTGARAGEALWLDWSQVDLQRRHVQFVQTKNGVARGVPLHSSLVAELERLPHRDGRVFRRPDGEPYALPSRPDDTSAGTRIKSAFSGAVRRAELSDFRVHDCRHTWATWHYQANRDLGALMRLGGWKTMSMVMRYAHTNVDELSHTIDAI